MTEYVPIFAALSTSDWDNFSDATSLLLMGLFIIAGLLLGYALRGIVGRWQAESIEKKMRLTAEAAEAELTARRKEADIAARAEVVKAREAFELSVKGRREELKQEEDRILSREAELDRKATRLDARETQLNEKLALAEDARTEAKTETARAIEQIATADKRFQELARMTHLEARREILAKANEALRADAASLSNRIQEAAREQGDAIAQKLIADAIQRCAVKHLSDLVTATVSLPNAEMKGRIVGRDGRNVRAFEAATGVTLLLDDAPDSVTLSAFDPLRRETARRALEALVADGRIHPASIEEAVAAAKAETDAAALEDGRNAALEAGVPTLSNDVLQLLGALRYRTSFSQNVLRHSVEVALITGTLAAELKLDASIGRRVGLLHDIGKALTGEQKGAHAQLGADFLKTNGEAEQVWKAVAAHHSEADTDGGVYGVLCAAADAISSARPGARLEKASDYVQRVKDIEELAKRHEGVTNVMAVQAGRDLRVVVDPAAIPDHEVRALARSICREISERVKFPGQIRVTIIRETRCVEYAK